VRSAALSGLTAELSWLQGASFSLLFAHGSALFQWCMLMTTAAVAVAFAVGWHTTRCSVALWLLVVSIHNRNLLLCDVGDALLAAALFWCMFLPLGARFSVDAALRRRDAGGSDDDGHRHVSAASLALIALVFLFSFVSASSRSGREWNDGTALYYALSLDSHATAIGAFVLRWPTATHVLTPLFVWLEWSVALGAISPVFNAPLRIVAVVSSFALHVGFGILLELGMWVWVPPAVSLCLLPPMAWTWWRRSVQARIAALRVLYNPRRRGLRNAVLIARELLLLGDLLHVEAAAAPSFDLAVQDAGAKDHQSTIVRNVDAVLSVARASPVCDVLWIVPLGDAIVRCALRTRVVAWLRACWLGDDEPADADDTAPLSSLSARAPPRQQPLLLRSLTATWRDAVKLAFYWLSGRSLLRESFVMCMLAATLLSAAPRELHSWPVTLTAVSWVRFARLEPRYRVMAPTVSRDDGWVVLNGARVDGLKVNVWTDELNRGRGVGWLVGSVAAWLSGVPESCCEASSNARTALSRPRIISQQFGGVMRWRNAWRHYQTREYERARLQLAQFLCRLWNQRQRDARKLLASFEIVWMSEVTLPSYHVRVIDQVPLWAHECVVVAGHQ
jgi:hypothetical protein